MDRKVETSMIDLCSKAQEVLLSVGVSREDSAQTVDVLLEAERSGVESHGFMRLGVYVDGLVNGQISAKPDIKTSIRNTVARIDGGNGLGQVVTCHAVNTCVELAKQYGVGVASVNRSNHFGIASYYARKIARENCVGFVASTAGPTMAPFGGVDRLLGTNPFSVAFPGQETNFCADMATSAAAKGKIRIYAQKGEEIPLGWALDREGYDTTDPQEAIKGIMLPMAGHKGYALAMAVDMLCGLLSGAALSGESSSVFQLDRPANTGHFVLALDIEPFLPIEEFKQRAQTWFETLRASKTRPGVSRVMIPGEPEALRLAQAGAAVLISQSTLEKLEQYHRKYVVNLE